MTHLLHGQRVLITRAPDQSGELADCLRALGAVPLEAPTIAVGPPEDWGALDAAIARLASYDWLVLTSPNGVRFMHERLGLRGAAWPDGLRLAAVGPKTAEVARSVGWAPALVPPQSHAEALALVLAPFAPGRRFLLARGNLAAPELPAALRTAGAVVDEAVVYANRAQGGPALAALVASADWAAFASGSAARNLVAALPDPTALGGVGLVSIGPKTSAVIRELGFEVAAEATEATMAALADAVGRAAASRT